MDLVLKISDDLILDRVWAHLVPLSAFGTESLNTTTKFLPIASSISKWSQLISHLPHPPLSHHDFTLAYANSQSQPFVSAWPRGYVPRQLLSLLLLTLIGIHVLYFLFAGLSFKYIFNHDMMRHPRFLKNQVRLEIQTSLRAFPVMTLLTLPWFQAEVMGYSKLYDGVDTYGYFYLFASVPLWVLFLFFSCMSHINSCWSYLLFTDYCIYWIHRWLHIPIFYKYIHKPHHKWISRLFPFIIAWVILKECLQFRHRSAHMLSTQLTGICNLSHITCSFSSSLSIVFSILPCSCSLTSGVSSWAKLSFFKFQYPLNAM